MASKACEAKWDANKNDCNEFLKAAATEVGVIDIPAGAAADGIIDYLEGSPSNWIKLPQGAHQDAYDKAKEGRFVVAGLTSTDMGRNNGHVAVVTSGDLVHSGSDNLDYPKGYWGTLGDEGKKCQGINHSFPAPQRRQDLRYYWKSLG